jgi:C-terminal processing protease CtpA/Prc
MLSSNNFTSSSSIAAAPATYGSTQPQQWTVERGSINGISAASNNAATHKLGYLRLSSFSSNAADDMHRAIAELERSGVSGYILDLRDNPGGLVKSGIDIARLLLDGHPTLFSITGRDGEPLQEVSLIETVVVCVITVV